MNILKKFLASRIVWRFSGLTYYTAVIATRGRYIRKDDLINEGRKDMEPFASYFSKSTDVLEFGCGIGVNLFGIADIIRKGYGLDINRFYIRIAKSLSSRFGFNNLYFYAYDGKNFPEIPKVHVILEKGVFERLPKNYVKYIINTLKEKYLLDDGVMILYFLTSRAKGTDFTKRLGDETYIFWESDEIETMLRNLGLDIVEKLSISVADYFIVKNSKAE